jgi:hypothetical protein
MSDPAKLRAEAERVWSEAGCQHESHLTRWQWGETNGRLIPQRGKLTMPKSNYLKAFGSYRKNKKR